MNTRSALCSLTSFGLAFGAMLGRKAAHPPETLSLPPLPAAVDVADRSSRSVAPFATSSSSGGATSGPDLPYSKAEEARLLERCKSLTESDPEAAFRAGMACWGFDRRSMAKAAEALVKKDPAAARRLLVDCPDLRSKSVLEGELMAAEVSGQPEETLRWAEAHLEGHVRTRALNAGIAVLAAKNPSAALEILSEWPPGNVKLGGQGQALGARMKEDANAALMWVAENTRPSERRFTGIQACLNFIKQNPTEGPAILPGLPLEYQKYMGFAMVWQAKSGPEQPLQPMMDALRTLPKEVQLPVISLWAGEPNYARDLGHNEFLAALSDPAERATAIEGMAMNRLSYFSANPKQSEVLEWLGQFQTPADKQAAARGVPYLTDLTEPERARIMAILK